MKRSDSKGHVPVDSLTGEKVKWSSFKTRASTGIDGNPAQIDKGFSHLPSLPESTGGRGCHEHIDMEAFGVSPMDEHNMSLLDQVHPRSWVDPTPPADFVYDLVAIGAGAGGLVSSKQSARRGANSALIEYHLAGGDCLNVGCVPSKALIRAARCAKEAKTNSDELGVDISPSAVNVNFPKIMERMRRLRAHIAPADSLETSVAVGVDVYQGKAHITSPNTVEVNGQTLKFKNLVIATGGSAALPSIPGLKEAPYTTNATLYNLTTLPKRVIVIGGGPIGLEMAQAFAIFGSEVTVTLRSEKILPKEDPDAADIIHKTLEADGINFVTCCQYEKVTYEARAGQSIGPGGDVFPEISLNVTQGGVTKVLKCDVLLVATGRKPNVEGLGLENAGVEYNTQDGVLVDNYLRTSNPNVWAVGDVCTRFQFTHVAGAMAGMVVENALFGGDCQFDHTLIPWATFTEPEVAHTGLYERDFAERGIECETYKTGLEHCDRAILESATEGFVKIHVLKGTDTILGATIVAPCAGEMISELTVAMQADIGLGTLGRVVHPYPTIAEAIKGCGIR